MTKDKRIQIRLEADLLKKVSEQSIKENVSLAQVIRKCIEAFFK